jgi:hypothetical protein
MERPVRRVAVTVPLPPLPSLTGDDENYRPGGRNMVAVLSQEHDQIDALCRELTDPGAAPERRREVAEVVTATVTRHLSAEEQYLYPAVRAALPDGVPLADREIAADAAVLRTLRELSSAAPKQLRFDELVDEVVGQLRRHTRTARTEMFPALREIVGEAELIRLGNRVEIAEEAAPTRPHPDAPATPPLNPIPGR